MILFVDLPDCFFIISSVVSLESELFSPTIVPEVESVFLYGILLLIIGISGLILPDTFLSKMMLPDSHKFWILAISSLTIVVGFYYIMTGYNNMTQFFYFTVYSRIIAFISLTSIGILFEQPIFSFIGVSDLLSSILTFWLLKSKEK